MIRQFIKFENMLHDQNMQWNYDSMWNSQLDECYLRAIWCAILIAHQLLWQNMEAPVSIFQESPLAGEPRERLFHIHSVNRYQLRTK